MPKDDMADLAALFDSSLNEPAEEPVEEDKPEEGERSAQPDSPPGKKAPGKKEVAPAPKTDKPDETDASTAADDRYGELLDEVQRYRKYGPLLDILEEEPGLARQVLAQKAGLQAEPAAQSQQPPAQPQPTQQEVEAAWRQRIEEDPASAVRDLIHLATQEATRGTRNASTRVLVNDYKARRRADDPLFARYEQLFDAMVRNTNADFILNYPDETLQAVENLAFGTWGREQRKKAANVKRTVPARERPQSLEENRVTTPTRPAQKRRELSEEERELARIYGEEALDVAEEPESPWRS